jgi:hypothetical protein
MANTNSGQFNSIGGADIHAVFGNYQFASLQMIRYATQREKGQIWTLGSPSPRATARGKRSVSGACVFTMIDRLNLVQAMSGASGSTNEQVFINQDEFINYANYNNTVVPTVTAAAQQAFSSGGTLTSAGIIGGAFNPFVSQSIFTASNFGQTSNAFLADQLLPFDITIVGAPEYGFQFAKRLIIHGVEIMSEASGTSIDDLVIEKQMAFIAKNVSDWVSLGDLGGATGTQ